MRAAQPRRFLRGAWPTLVLLLVVGSAAMASRAGPSRTSAPASNQVADQTDGLPVPSAQPRQTSERVRPALLLVDEGVETRPGTVRPDVPVERRTGSLRARPVDPLTLADLEGYEPLDFGHHYSSTISPDGRTLAVMVWPSGSPLAQRDARLQIVDLDSWTTDTPPVVIAESGTGPLFGDDGGNLYWLAPARLDPAHFIPRAYRLLRYSLASRTLTPLVELPESFMPHQMRMLRSGRHLAVYGIPTSTGNLAEDVPHILTIDLANERITTDLRLAGVRAGQFRVEGAAGDQFPSEMFWPGLGWDIARDRLYVAHAESNRLTVVDLAAGTVLKQKEVRIRQSWFDRLLGSMVSTASAKGGPTTERRAIVSPDGSRLYVTGTRLEMYKDGSGHWHERFIPLGLQVIETESMAQVHRAELPLNGMTLSADGRWLLGHDSSLAAGAGDPTSGACCSLSLLDTERMRELQPLSLPGQYAYAKFAPDRRHLYAFTTTEDASTKRSTFRVIDMNTRTVITERHLPWGFTDLIDLTPNASGN